jgi:hypothetical protein
VPIGYLGNVSAIKDFVFPGIPYTTYKRLSEPSSCSIEIATLAIDSDQVWDMSIEESSPSRGMSARSDLSNHFCIVLASYSEGFAIFARVVCWMRTSSERS